MRLLRSLLFLLLAGSAFAERQYDLLLRGGHVIDPKNKISKICDVAIRDRVIAAVAPGIDPATAFKTVDLKGLYVTPGLVDIHVHAFASTGEPLATTAVARFVALIIPAIAIAAGAASGARAGGRRKA